MTRATQILILILTGMIFQNIASAQSKRLEAGVTYYMEVTAEDGTVYQYLFTPSQQVDVVMNEKSLARSSGKKQEATTASQTMDEHIYQDAESLRKYGKLFPGIDGKLYGTSEAELDEMVASLNEEIAVPASKNSVRELYQELRTENQSE